ncbi:methyltransferase domain-containing protein [Actinomyces sp. B33]|uniref:class I SAM-dependent methyltransferase n=1 Tax=Actinomyces sp. B33 TaxID=2942131 RepID=UPI002340A4AF|nr:class I SAM-dependent methyltransferase [Actinomyces sp. B33]MDC4232704.1 methyltransferase domain-containing protein [Actinomyces sp. B33]
MTEHPPVRGDRSGPEEERLQGHWLMARLGKRVLRPGGIELTRRLIAAAAPGEHDRIVEFGPGVGRTAEILLRSRPASYIGVDPNSEPAGDMRAVLAAHPRARLHVADAQDTGLEEASADLVVGEAMLTMHSAAEKLRIMREAHRILAPGGRYAIHELGFSPDDLPDAVVDEVSRALSRTIKVGARPLTHAQWRALLEEAGFEVVHEDSNPMRLLEPSRLIADEGPMGALRFLANVRRNPAARTRLLAMRAVFRANADHLHAVAYVAVKPRD